MRVLNLVRVAVAAACLLAPGVSLAWGGLGHRTVAAIAERLLPPAKVARINSIMSQLETDNNFIDGASYPDEYVRNHDPDKQFSGWHFADLPDDGSPFSCGECLFWALQTNIATIRQGKGDYDEAVALAWVIHLMGDLHQPLHMDARLKGGNGFHVTYRGGTSCPLYSGGRAKAELHSVWDDCLVGELANGRLPDQLAGDLLAGAGVTSYAGRPELSVPPSTRADQPWLSWGNDSHTLATRVAFGTLQDGADLQDQYITAPGGALDTVKGQLLRAGIRLAAILDRAVN